MKRAVIFSLSFGVGFVAGWVLEAWINWTTNHTPATVPYRPIPKTITEEQKQYYRNALRKTGDPR